MASRDQGPQQVAVLHLIYSQQERSLIRPQLCQHRQGVGLAVHNQIDLLPLGGLDRLIHRRREPFAS